LTTMFRTYAAWVRGATDADVAIIQLAMNSERSAADSASSSQALPPPLAPVAKLGTGLATGAQAPRAQLVDILARLKWRRGWDSKNPEVTGKNLNSRPLKTPRLPVCASRFCQ
jgi:hypothetical protein